MKYIRSNKLLIELFLVLLLMIILLSLRNVYTDFKADRLQENYVPVSEAILELQFTVYSQEEWQDFFENYHKAYITGGMVTDIIKRLGASEVVSFLPNGKETAVTRADWNTVYKQLLDYLDINGQITERELLILSKEQQETGTLLYTNAGTFFTKLPVSYFSEWENYYFYLIGTECIGVEAVLETEAVIPNVYVTGSDENRLSFLYNESYYEKMINTGGQVLAGGVADILVQNGQITAVRQKQDYIVGNLLSYDEHTIEIEGYGKIVHSGKVPVYQVYGTVKELAVSDIILGNMEVKYIIGPNEVCAILITTAAEMENVRVLLLAEDGGKFRSEVYLSGNGNFSVSNKTVTEYYPAGTVIDASRYLTTQENTLVITPENEAGMLYLCDANGKKLTNDYSGHMEVRQYEGGFCVVNDVPLETYLYSVVPSEMPSSYQPEALKAQAVCARSYAYMQVTRADLAAYGAHIDDSTSYQVYNNVPKTEASIRAVDETAGKVMLYAGKVVEAYYFSTSMGYTDTAEVWNVLDTADYGYLKRACLETEASQTVDLSDEGTLKAYLNQDSKGYDSDVKFYRWQVRADYSELTQEIKELLKNRRAAVKRHVTYYKEDGKTETDTMEGFGTITSLYAAERSSSGSILTLLVQFEHGSAAVKNEYNIRKVLACGAASITYMDGSESNSVSLLPSAFCTVEKQSDGTYLLCGGGYGHGLGMSQNGANGLAKAGYRYDEILNYFYNGIELMDVRSLRDME